MKSSLSSITKYVGPLTAMLLLTLLLAACGDTTDNLSINGTNPTTAVVTTSAPTTAAATTVATTAAPATTASATTAAPAKTTVPTTTAPVATTAAPVTTKPPTTTTPPVKADPTTAPATIAPATGQAYGPKGACSGDALAKAAGKNYSVEVDTAVQIKNGNVTTPVHVVFVGEKSSGSDFYENTRGYVVSNNCASLPGAFKLPANELGWGDYAPEIKVQNTHNDGREQIVIDGVIGAHTSTASLYSFDPAKGVRLQGNLVGDWGAGFHKPELYGGSEKDVAFYAWRNYGRAQTVIVNYLRWQPDGAGEGKYVGFENYVTYAFETPNEITYPEQAILAYYRALTLKKYDVAFNLLGNAYKNGQTLDKYKAGYATTKRVWVESFEVVGLDPAKFEETIADGNYDVKVEIAAEDIKDGKSVITRFGGTWTVSVKGNILKLEKANITAK